MFELWHHGEISVSEAQFGQFYGRLSQTIGWCKKQAVPDDPCGSLRSLKLRPPVLHSGRADAVRHVGVERERALGTMLLKRNEREFPDLAGGRLLVCFPHETVWDGAAESASRGFFDAYDTPPWDTLVAYFEEPGLTKKQWDRNYLVAFVPLAFIEDAQAGID